VFEYEKKWLLVAVFFMGMFSPYFVHLVHFLLLDRIDFKLNGEYLNDFVYCFVGIALVEVRARGCGKAARGDWLVRGVGCGYSGSCPATHRHSPGGRRRMATARSVTY